MFLLFFFFFAKRRKFMIWSLDFLFWLSDAFKMIWVIVRFIVTLWASVRTILYGVYLYIQIISLKIIICNSISHADSRLRYWNVIKKMIFFSFTMTGFMNNKNCSTIFEANKLRLKIEPWPNWFFLVVILVMLCCAFLPKKKKLIGSCFQLQSSC